MKRLFFIIFILSFIFSTELAAVMFRVRLMDSDHNEFLENITLHFTDLDDRTLETIELTRNSGILKERSITGKFNLNLILKYKNIEFIDGLSGMPYVLWGGQFDSNEISKYSTYDFKVQPLSYNFSRVIEIYKAFFSKSKIFNEKIKNLLRLNILPEKLVPDILVEYPPHFVNDQRKPFIYIEDNIYTFYLFPAENCTEQIDKFYGYVYALQFLPDDFDGEILHTMPEARKKIFPDEIGKSGVDDKNILLENLRIFSQSILFGSYNEELNNLRVSENNIGKLKKELEDLKKNWQQIKAIPGKKQEKFHILKRLIQIKKKIRGSSELNESTDRILGVHAIVLLELYRNLNLNLLKDILEKVKSGNIKKSSQLFELFQNNEITAKIIKNRIKEPLELIADNQQEAVSLPLDGAESTVIEPVALETKKSNDDIESRIVTEFTDALEKSISDKIPAKRKKNIESFKKVKAIYEDFDMGRLIFDTFMWQKRKIARELLTNIKDDRNWIQGEIAKLKKIQRPRRIKVFKNYSESLDELYKEVSTFLNKEDEKIMFIGQNAYSALQILIKKITTKIREMEVKFGKLLFLNDKFKLYSKENLSSLKDRISADVKLLKNNLLTVDHVNLSTKIVIYITIRNMLNDYINDIFEYKKLEAGINLDLDLFNKQFSENGHYLTKALFIIMNSRKQGMTRKIRDSNRKYEKFSKKIIKEYRFSRENVKRCLLQISRFLEKAVPINEEKIFLQLSKSGTSLLEVEKSVSGELEIIKKIRTKLDKQSLDIKYIEKRVEKTEKQKALKIVKIPVIITENEEKMEKLRKKTIKQEVEIRQLKKVFPVNSTNDEEVITSRAQFEIDTVEQKNKPVKQISDRITSKQYGALSQDADLDSVDIMKKSYYYSDITVNGKLLSDSLSSRHSFNSSVNGLRVEGKLKTNGISIVSVFMYENNDTSDKTNVKFDFEKFSFLFIPEKPGSYRLRLGFSDIDGVEYLLKKDLILTVFPNNLLRLSKSTERKRVIAAIPKVVDRQFNENKTFEIDSVNKLYKVLKVVFRTRNLKRFKQLIINRESIDIYNLISDMNRLFMDNGFLNLKITPMETKVMGNTTQVRFLWTIETDEKEYSGISGFVIVADEDGNLGIVNFSGNRFFE